MEADLYEESPDIGNIFRQKMLDEVHALIQKEQREADRRRECFFRPSLTSIKDYEASLPEYRTQFREMLGWPLTKHSATTIPSASIENVAEDSLGSIARTWIETLPGVRTYGLHFRPHGAGPFPLVVAQHGALGTPELCSGFSGSANYNDMTRRVLRRGIAVFAPQLLLWFPGPHGPGHEKDAIDKQLKQLGGSLAALELFRIRTVIDHFAASDDIDAERIGMIGLSYGGFYTLFAAALDVRIKVAVSSCFFNDRRIHASADWVWFGSANHFLDAEVGALVCPRPLYIEVGKKDKNFTAATARPEAERLRAFYQKLGIEERFRYKEHEGAHELDEADDGIDFLCRHLGVEA